METKLRTGSVISVDINATIGTVTFNVTGVGSKTLHLERVHADNRAYAALHGFKQRCVDGGAIERDGTTGRAATAGEKFAGIVRLVDFYESGAATWRTGGGGGGGMGMLAAAIVAAGLKVDSAEFRAKVRGMSKAERATLAAIPAVAAELKRLTAAETAGIDTEALLATL